MENKELKKSIPEELNAEELNMVSGGFEVMISPSAFTQIACRFFVNLRTVER